jgi:hypothetical protein
MRDGAVQTCNCHLRSLFRSLGILPSGCFALYDDTDDPAQYLCCSYMS